MHICMLYDFRMLYTEAVIMEVLRKSSLVPLGLFHSTLSDTGTKYHILLLSDSV